MWNSQFDWRHLWHILNCTFQNNRAAEGGAIQIYNADPSNVTIMNCMFFNNSATFGGAISIGSEGVVLIANSSFLKNNAIVGAAIYARNQPVVIEGVSDILLCTLILLDVTIRENCCSCGEYNETRGGAMYFSGVNVNITGSTGCGSEIALNSPQGAIQGINVFLHLSGKVAFFNNSGENGGVISLLNNVQLIFLENCTVAFIGNTVTRYGGAIYIEGVQKRITTQSDNCNGTEVHRYCVITVLGRNNLSFVDNHAELSGHAVYASIIAKILY